MTTSSNDSQRSPRGREPMIVAAVVAACVAAVAINLTDSSERGARRAARQVEDGDRPALITLLAPDGTLKRAPSRFEWQPLAGATSYELTLYADDARVLWTSERGTATAVDRPAAIALPTGQQYHWQVQAFAGEKVMGESRLATFEVF
jgi:hypothetical protein